MFKKILFLAFVLSFWFSGSVFAAIPQEILDVFEEVDDDILTISVAIVSGLVALLGIHFAGIGFNTFRRYFH